MAGQYVYFQYYCDKKNKECWMKIGQTCDVHRRSYQIGYIDEYRYFENCSYADALFMESYLRMRLQNYSIQHPILKMEHIGNDYFYYDKRYYGIMEKHFIKFYKQWLEEAYQMICGLRNTTNIKNAVENIDT